MSEDAKPEAVTPWPAARAEEGKIYGFVDPNHGQSTDMVAMTLATWNKFAFQQDLMTKRILQLEHAKRVRGIPRRIILPQL